MSVFAIIGTTNPPAVGAAVAKQYGASHYQLAANVWLVHDVGNTKYVADKIGITNGAVGSSGVVIEMTAYSGYTNSAAWAFLAQFPEARSNG